MESSWIPKPHLRIGHEPSNRWPTQNQHNSIFVDILSYIVSFGAFLISLVFFWYIITSDYGFCVCICVFFLKKIYFAWFLFAFLALFWFVLELDGWRREEGLREMREEKLWS